MGKHAQWRKLVKKLRRKRIRSIIAIARDEKLLEEQRKRDLSPTYQTWLQEQTVLEEFNASEEKRLAMQRQQIWAAQEEAALMRWREQQSRLAHAKSEKFKKEMMIKEEWEREQRKLQEPIDAAKKNEEEKKRKQAELLAHIDAYIEGRADLPEEVNVSSQTQPGCPDCPFFSKTGACRFKDSCSRNHFRPGVSRTLLVTNFYDHFGLKGLHQDEYDTDLGLEYEDSEMYQHFNEFYKDVLPEFEQCGRVTQFKVCNNEEPHLRGNVYVEFFSRRHALKAYRKFQGRFYAGRRLNVEFANIPSWKNAICGLFHRQKCPMGKTCNFLHVFRNPNNAFKVQDGHSSSRRQLSRSRSRSPLRRRSRSKEWNWSEGSDSENGTRRKRRSRSHSKSKVRTKNRDSDSDRRRSRSRSPTRIRSKTGDSSRDRRNKRPKDKRRDEKYQRSSRSPKRDKKRHKDDSRDESSKKSKKDRNDDLRSERESNGRDDISKRSKNDDSKSEKDINSREDSSNRSKKTKDEDKNRSKEKTYTNESTKKHEKDDSYKKYKKDHSSKKQKDKSDEIEKKDKKSKKSCTEESELILKHKSSLDSDKGQVDKSVNTPNKKNVNGDL